MIADDSVASSCDLKSSILKLKGSFSRNESSSTMSQCLNDNMKTASVVSYVSRKEHLKEFFIFKIQ